VKSAALLLLALVLAGCGEGEREHGAATLWVTKNQGAQVVYAGSVPAGLNGIQTVEKKLKVTTRYGGRYVQSIGGVSGSLSHQRDWFFYVDGIEGSVSAASVRVKPGDVLWWDYRHWTGRTMDIPVVVGAYPQPFLRAGPTAVSGEAALAAPIAKQVHGVVGLPSHFRSLIEIGKVAPNSVSISRFRSGYRLELGTAIAKELAADPTALRRTF
jgi:hypothetical protein